MKALIFSILCFFIVNVQAEEHDNGFVNKDASGKFQVWNVDKGGWSSIELFWQGFAKTSQAKSWGSANTYPNYDEVSEFDTFQVELEEGTCLMQFYHYRWRRANDVQRWHDTFNEYSGCPYVFD
jgi:hypothetical protein